MTVTTLTAPSLLVLIKWTEPTVLKQEKTHWETARESSSGNLNNWLKLNYKQTNKQRHVKHVPGAGFKPSAFHYLLIHTAAEQSTGGLAYVAHSGWGPQRLANQHLPHAWIQGRPDKHGPLFQRSLWLSINLRPAPHPGPICLGRLYQGQSDTCWHHQSSFNTIKAWFMEGFSEVHSRGSTPPHGKEQIKVFWVWPNRRRPQSRARTQASDSGAPEEELKKVARDREVWEVW